MKLFFLILSGMLWASKTMAQPMAEYLVFADEFNYTGLPDSTKWTFETKGNASGWGNNEKQYYTSGLPANAYVKDGTLKITALKENKEGKAYTSARLSSAGKAEFTYGRIEVRAKLPKGKGTWPAIWMLGSNIHEDTRWPACGEIDIMEHVGYDADSIHGTIHTEAYNHMKGTHRGKGAYIQNPYSDFHVYSIDWSESKIDFLLDGNIYYTTPNEQLGTKEWPFNQPFFLILNLAIGGNWGGKHGIDDDIFPAVMEIDFVRVYQKKPQSIQQLIAQRAVVDTNLILPPAWAFGVLYGGYTNQQETIQRVKEIKQHQYPIDAYWIDSWFWSYSDKGKGPHKYIDFIADTLSYPNRKEMWSTLQQQGIKGGFWVWDCIQQNGNEQAFKDFFDKGFFKNVYTNKDSWHNNSTTTAMFETGKDNKGTLNGNINFDNPAAVAYFKQRMKHFFDEGADFIKLDRTSDINTCKTMFEMTQEFGKETQGRGFILSHTGGQERSAYKRYPTKWTDDTRSDWNTENPLISFPSWVPKVALKENIAMFSDPSKKTSSIPFLTNDMGGFDMGKTIHPSEELFIRWMQFSMFTPIVELFSQPENPTSNLPWKYSERADTLFRKFAHLRMQLFPYIYSYAHRSRIEGSHMIGKFPKHTYQYTFGNELLVAPVYTRDANTQQVYLPAGNWINYWTGHVLAGNQYHYMNAPIDQIPLLVKAGSIIPMRNYASSVESGSNKFIALQIYSGADGHFWLIEDDGISNEYLSGKYAATLLENKETEQSSTIVIHAVNGFYKSMPSKRLWTLQFFDSRKPVSATCNGKKVNILMKGDNKFMIELNSVDVKQKSTIVVKFK
ncbi:TIM-barrel domain-containing protein [Phnomibacter ginsenosidimutans]|nr:TIM-barrel domain-containing protein [Phnomibacter ginsenosidimutans]